MSTGFWKSSPAETERFRRQFQMRRRATLAAFGVWILTIVLYTSFDLSLNWVIAVFLVIAAIALSTWRCPRCRAGFGRSMFVDSCPHCGLPFGDRPAA